MRCRACNRPIIGSDAKNGDLCSHCRALINKDLADYDSSYDEELPRYTHPTESMSPIQVDEHNFSGSDTQNINTKKYFYDFFDNF